MRRQQNMRSLCELLHKCVCILIVVVYITHLIEFIYTRTYSNIWTSVSLMPHIFQYTHLYTSVKTEYINCMCTHITHIIIWVRATPSRASLSPHCGWPVYIMIMPIKEWANETGFVCRTTRLIRDCKWWYIRQYLYTYFYICT